jgi:hypothetical protein
MERRNTIAGAPEVNVAVRVRGMSQEQRFFDVQTITTRITHDFVVILLGEQVDLDVELHITNLQTEVGGTFRVAWTSPYADDGSFRAGLELLDPEGEIWAVDSLPDGAPDGDAGPTVVLQCARCAGKVSTEVPEAEGAALGAGFTIARHCDTCKATTGWVFHVESPVAADAASEATRMAYQSDPAAPRPAAPLKENREKGRAPIRMGIKIIRTKYGTPSHDVGETLNVSRTGAYFTTKHSYEPGEIVDVILPYHPEGMPIPVKAKVIRQDESPGSYQKRVAIHLLTGTTPIK